MVVVVVGAKREQARESCDTGAAGRAERFGWISGKAPLQVRQETKNTMGGGDLLTR